MEEALRAPCPPSHRAALVGAAQGKAGDTGGRGMTLLGVDKCPSLVLSLLKKGDFAEEGEAEG